MKQLCNEEISFIFTSKHQSDIYSRQFGFMLAYNFNK